MSCRSQKRYLRGSVDFHSHASDETEHPILGQSKYIFLKVIYIRQTKTPGLVSRQTLYTFLIFIVPLNVSFSHQQQEYFGKRRWINLVNFRDFPTYLQHPPNPPPTPNLHTISNSPRLWIEEKQIYILNIDINIPCLGIIDSDSDIFYWLKFSLLIAKFYITKRKQENNAINFADFLQVLKNKLNTYKSWFIKKEKHTLFVERLGFLLDKLQN